MVPKQESRKHYINVCFRAVLFRMVPKRMNMIDFSIRSFRAVLFRMVPKLIFNML